MVDWDALVIGPCMQVFGDEEPITYIPAAGGAFPIIAIFDNGFFADNLVSGDGIPEFQTVNPVLGVQLSQFPALPVSGDRVMVPSVGATYFINEVKTDGKGGAKLELTLSA